jgi:hypothetical protein
MLAITNPRAEKVARQLARTLHTTIPVAVAMACEHLLREYDQPLSLRGKRRRINIARMHAEVRKRRLLPEDEAEQGRLSDHSYLYDEYGLPR